MRLYLPVVAPAQVSLAWTYSRGATDPLAWPAVPTVADATDGLRHDGSVRLTVPGDWKAQRPTAVPGGPAGVWSAVTPRDPGSARTGELFWIGLRDHQPGGGVADRRHRPHPVQRRVGAHRPHHPRARDPGRGHGPGVPGARAPQPPALPAPRSRGALRRPRGPGGRRHTAGLDDLDTGRRLPARAGRVLPGRPRGRRDQLRQLRPPDRDRTGVGPAGGQRDQGVQLPLRRRGRGRQRGRRPGRRPRDDPLGRHAVRHHRRHQPRSRSGRRRRGADR